MEKSTREPMTQESLMEIKNRLDSAYTRGVYKGYWWRQLFDDLEALIAALEVAWKEHEIKELGGKVLQSWYEECQEREHTLRQQIKTLEDALAGRRPPDA